jgi:hypothetical protein
MGEAGDKSGFSFGEIEAGRKISRRV